MNNRVLCICPNNTCGSAMMEALVEEFCRKQDIAVNVESAGMMRSAHQRLPANPYAVAEMEKRGLDISGHTSRWIGEISSAPVPALIIVTDEESATSVRNAFEDEDLASRIVIVLNGDRGGIANPWSDNPDRSESDAKRAYSECAASMAVALPSLLHDRLYMAQQAAA